MPIIIEVATRVDWPATDLELQPSDIWRQWNFGGHTAILAVMAEHQLYIQKWQQSLVWFAQSFIYQHPLTLTLASATAHAHL
jgi:hypothetical protein